MINIMLDLKALQFESRFSLPPNSLGYCGKETAAHRFKECIINGNCSGVKKEVKNFIVLHPYLKTLSEITGLSMFDYKIIESYWIGNDLLKKAKPEDYLVLLRYFKKQGVPDFFVDELRENKPEIFIPNHLFQVLHIGVGKASGAVPFNLKSINNCMIRWGKVKKISKNNAGINLNSLEKKAGKFKLIQKPETIPLDENLVPGLKTGDTVAVHWNMVVKILTEKEEKNLKFWTSEVCKLNF